MAEGLAVAGSAVGIISLSIQISQGLLKYYGSWKDQDNAVSEIYVSLENLIETSKILSTAIQPPATFDNSVKCNVEKNINCINKSLERLRTELEKIQGSETPQPGARATLRRHVRRALYPFREETLKKIEGAVAEARSNLDLALQALQLQSISVIRHDITSLVRWQEDQETQGILSWLSPKNFWLQQADLSNQRQPGTWQWLLEHPDFLDWEEGNKETIWCRGGPGVGKTVLTSVVVDFLEKDLPIRDVGLTFIYCNHKESQSQRIEYFLGAIIRQLVERRHIIPKDVRTLYKSHRGKGTSPTCSEYLNLLQSLDKECSEGYIIIDALDECVDKDGQLIWSELLSILRGSVSNMRLLYTSRHIDKTAGILSRSTVIDVLASEHDLKTYVQGQLQSTMILRQFCEEDPTLQDDILQTVVSKSERMFLAARLYLESLSSKTNRRAVKKALNRLPTKLDDNYDEAMNRIKQQRTQHIAFKVLSWIVYAVRPLRLKEVQHAVATDELDPNDESITEDCLTPQSILINACAGLVKVDEKRNIIGLVHKTTQEYFDRTGMNHFPQAQQDIATTCLKYLSLEVFSDGPCSTYETYQCRVAENPLLEYAARSLGNHILELAEQSLHNLPLDFFLDKVKCSCASQVLFRYPTGFHGSHYAAYFGLTGIVQLLLQIPDIDLEARDDKRRTPLHWAAKQGHEAVVKFLVEGVKVGVEPKDDFDETPLYFAAENGHEAVVRFLVENAKVNVNSEDMDYYMPLWVAVKNGHVAVVRVLVESGKVAIDLKHDDSPTLLWCAAGYGHDEVVRLLLETGKMDVNFQASWGGTPLWVAAESGCEAVVRLLLDTREVDVNVRNSLGETPLWTAAKKGHEAVVRLLLDTRKVDVHVPDFSCRMPISIAEEEGHEAIVRLLQSFIAT